MAAKIATSEIEELVERVIDFGNDHAGHAKYRHHGIGQRAKSRPSNFWVNRLNAAPEELGDVFDGTGKDQRDLITFVNA